jgi:hypothetical protein
MNLLKSKIGRLTAFGGLYLSEGLPQGLTGFALTLEFKRCRMDVAAISAFGAMTALPWAWKFLMGPLVDNLHIRRFGARKQWIVICQVGMLLGLCLALMNMPTFVEGGGAKRRLYHTLHFINVARSRYYGTPLGCRDFEGISAPLDDPTVHSSEPKS